MQVKAVIELLQKMDPEALVIIQKDAEGNGHSPFFDLFQAVYVKETTWYGKVYPNQFTADDNCMTTEEWDKLKNNKKLQAVVLVPTN